MEQFSRLRLTLVIIGLVVLAVLLIAVPIVLAIQNDGHCAC